jgi:hypothetical protein
MNKLFKNIMKKEFLFYLSHAAIAFVLILWIILISNHKDSQIHFLQNQIDSISYVQRAIHGDQFEQQFIQNTVKSSKQIMIEPVNEELKQQLFTIKVMGGVIAFGVLIMFLVEFIRACRSGDAFPKTPCIFINMFRRKKNTRKPL